MLPRAFTRLAWAACILLIVIYVYRNAAAVSEQYRALAESAATLRKGAELLSHAQEDAATIAHGEGTIADDPTQTPSTSEPLQLSRTATAAESATATPGDKIIVMGKLMREDTDWVHEQLPDWQNAIYTVDNTSAELHTPRNKGREANPYLLYLIQHYDKLPSTIVFLHSHRAGYPAGWHTDVAGYDNVRAMNGLSIDFVQRSGYVNLRCNWSPGCPDEVMPHRPARPDEEYNVDHVFLDAWHDLFGKRSVVPEVIAAPCCAQFAVSKEQVLKRPLEDYKRFHQWLMDTGENDDVSGRVFEYLWHIIFGKDPVYCPEPSQCYMNVYGPLYSQQI